MLNWNSLAGQEVKEYLLIRDWECMNFTVLEDSLMQLLLFLNCAAGEVKSSQQLKMTIQVLE